MKITVMPGTPPDKYLLKPSFLDFVVRPCNQLIGRGYADESFNGLEGIPDEVCWPSLHLTSL